MSERTPQKQWAMEGEYRLTTDYLPHRHTLLLSVRLSLKDTEVFRSSPDNLP
jgi:hypothetical protein